MKEHYVFLAIYNPSEKLLEGLKFKTLPAIGGVLASTDDNPQHLKQFTYAGAIRFDDILNDLLKLVNKESEYYQ